jgi:hypothetical protein
MVTDTAFLVVKRWIRKIRLIPEVIANLKLFDLEIQFLIKGEDPFFLSLTDGLISLHKGRLGNIDPGKKVTVESNYLTMKRLLGGHVKFLDEWRADRIYLVGELPRKAWFSRMIRIGSAT